MKQHLSHINNTVTKGQLINSECFGNMSYLKYKGKDKGKFLLQKKFKLALNYENVKNTCLHSGT